MSDNVGVIILAIMVILFLVVIGIALAGGIGDDCVDFYGQGTCEEPIDQPNRIPRQFDPRGGP